MSRKQNSGNGMLMKIKRTSIHFTGSSYIMRQTGDPKKGTLKRGGKLKHNY